MRVFRVAKVGVGRSGRPESLCSTPRWCCWSMAALALALAIGCSEDLSSSQSSAVANTGVGDPIDSEPPPFAPYTPGGVTNIAPRRASEEPLLEVAQKVNEFAGYYCESGDLVVLLAAPESSYATIVESIRALIPSDTIASCKLTSDPTRTPKLAFRSGRHTFLALRSWRDQLAQTFIDVPGARSLGIDYAANRLHLGADAKEPDAITMTQALIETLSVPPDAYHINAGTPRRARLILP
jgi:hypothetical protein